MENDTLLPLKVMEADFHPEDLAHNPLIIDSINSWVGLPYLNLTNCIHLKEAGAE
jgi:hypothetical protein